MKVKTKILFIIYIIMLLVNLLFSAVSAESTGEVSNIVGGIPIQGDTDKPDVDIETVLEAIPDTIELEETEIEAISSVLNKVDKKIMEILKEKGIKGYIVSTYGIANEVHKYIVKVYESPLSFEAKPVGEKNVTVQFSNSGDYKQEYSDYIRGKLKDNTSITMLANINLNENIGSWEEIFKEAQKEIIDTIADDSYVVEFATRIKK